MWVFILSLCISLLLLHLIRKFISTKEKIIIANDAWVTAKDPLKKGTCQVKEIKRFITKRDGKTSIQMYATDEQGDPLYKINKIKLL